MRPSRDSWAVDLVRVTARRATCLRRSVGCVLLDARGHVLATGYNGVHAGAAHCNEPDTVIVQGVHAGLRQDGMFGRGGSMTTVYPHACPGATAPSGTGLDSCQAIHAEQNALLQCREVYGIDTAYVSVSPCVTCTKLLLNTSCRRIVFGSEYADQAGRALWEGAGRSWELAADV